MLWATKKELWKSHLYSLTQKHNCDDNLTFAVKLKAGLVSRLDGPNHTPLRDRLTMSVQSWTEWKTASIYRERQLIQQLQFAANVYFAEYAFCSEVG